MNLLTYLNENVDLNKLEDLSGDQYEMGIVRYVMKETAKLFYRDYIFFFDKENIYKRYSIYNKKVDITNINDFSTVCKSYCNVIRDSLKYNYNIYSELISPYNDYFKHIDLLIKTKNGNNFIVDPLSDLVEMQVGLRTNNFASEKHYNDTYKDSHIDNISFLDNKEINEIDNKIDYKKNNIYTDEMFYILKIQLEDLENLLSKNDQIAFNLLGGKYNGESISTYKKTYIKLLFLNKYLDYRKYLNGIVDLNMYCNLVIKDIFTESEQKNIHCYSFFVDKDDIKDESLRGILGNDNRKRGVVVNYANYNFIITLNSKILEYKNDEWNEKINRNKIFIKPQYSVKLLDHLRINGADRNIIHNNEFLKRFHNFENSLLNSGHTLEEIKENNVLILDDAIYTKDEKSNVSYKIEDGNLIIKNFTNNFKYTVFYKDEGRDIYYKKEKILNESERINLSEFDSNGIFILDDDKGIENLVEPLSDGKFLSRNSSYYESKTYSELNKERLMFGNILTDDDSKRNLVILEYLSNASAKVYFEELKKQINNQDNMAECARNCLEEDCTNIIRLLKNEPLIKIKYNLPEGKEKVPERYIEMDNKQILYLFCSNLETNEPMHIITPGLGSIFIGPMLKSLYGYDYTNILFSLYSNDEELIKISNYKSFEEKMSNNLWKTTNNQILLLDDNVGSCNTMNIIKQNLEERGKNCKFAAIKYNWNFYNQVKKGELEHSTFNVRDVDFLTIIDDPGYWIMRDSIKALKEKGGDAYVNVMKREGFYQSNHSDIEILMELAEKYSIASGVDLYDCESNKIKKTSSSLCVKLKNQIKDIDKEYNENDFER